MRNPLKRKWLVQRYRPMIAEGPLRNMGLAVAERAPAPSERLFWTLAGAQKERQNLNAGMAALHSKDRFRVVVRP